MMRRLFSCVLALAAVPVFVACGEGRASDLNIEELPSVTPSLPTVPTLPPPPYPVTYPDTSYSVYGLRRRETTTMDTEVDVTGYIARVYEPEVCEEGHTCPTPAAPHMWIADARGEADETHWLMVVGYAENQQAIDDAREQEAHGHAQPSEEESGITPIPTDFYPGAKVRLHGRFARIASSGFNVSEGLLEYRTHTTIEPGEIPDAGRRR
ncbi:MAG: hypothetical protein U0234_00885 [Sandaracinus sp.]